MLEDNKNKLTLIIDGNWLLMSRISVFRENKFDSDVELMKGLKVLLVQSINLVLRTFPEIDNVIFVADGGSWRKQLDIPEILSKNDITYKGNRTHDDVINWDIVFEEYNKFIDTIKSCGISTYKAKDVEGDDWCWYISNKLNNAGINCIIWSKDKDLTQLVHTSNNGCFVGCWNKEGGLTIEDKNEDDIDFFFNFDFNENKNILNSIIKKTKVNKITPYNVVIDKIIRGDVGDNIFPVVKRVNDNGKEFRVGSKELDFNLDIHNESAVIKYFKNLLENKKYSGKVKKSIDEIIEHFKYNTKLVELNKTSYPEYILDELDNNFNNYNVCKDLKILFDKVNAEKNTIINILETI